MSRTSNQPTLGDVHGQQHDDMTDSHPPKIDLTNHSNLDAALPDEVGPKQYQTSKDMI